MTKRSWIRNVFTRPATRAIRKAPDRVRPALEALEDRTVPSTLFTVTNTLDDGSVGSLRWAVGQANTTTGADAIAFNDGTSPGTNFYATPHTITLTGGELDLIDTATTTITGPGASLLSVSGNNASRVFAVSSGASAAISGLTVT